MQLPSSHLSGTARSAVRFTVVGSTGTLIQYGIYYALLLLFARVWEESSLTANIAFTTGFLIEGITNYLLTAYYTFSSRPSWKNLGGFITGRGVNYLVQMGTLNLLLLVLDKEIAGAAAIVIAGIVNYFVVRIFFRQKPGSQEPAAEDTSAQQQPTDEESTAEESASED